MVSDWIEVQLQDVVTKLGDGLHGTPKYSENGEYYFINGNNLENGQIVFKEQTKRVDHTQYLKYKKELNERTLLVSINGTIGNVAYYNGEKVVLGKSACYFNLKDDIDKGYVRYVLSGHYFQSYLHAFATGTTIKNVSLKSMREFSFPIPPLPEQKAIAHILGSLDDKIELNRQMNETLEAMAQALFKSWFVDFDPVIDNALAAGNAIPDEMLERAEQRKGIEKKDNSEIQNLFPNEFECTEEMGWIPKGWGNGTLSDICFFGKGKINTSELSLENYVSTENMNKEKAGISYAASIASTNQVPKFSVGQTLISNIRPYFKKIWLASFDGGRSNDVLGFQANNSAVNEYLFNLLYQDSFFDYMTATSKGTKMPRGDKAAIMSWSVAIPSSKLMEEFSELAKPMYLANNLRSLQTIELAKLRDTLLPKLMSGELRISDAAVWVEEI